MSRKVAKQAGTLPAAKTLFEAPDAWQQKLMSTLLDSLARLQFSRVSRAANKATVQHTPEFIIRLDATQYSTMRRRMRERLMNSVRRRIRTRGDQGTTLVLQQSSPDESCLYLTLAALYSVGQYVHTLHFHSACVCRAFMAAAADALPNLEHLVLGVPSKVVGLRSVSLPRPAQMPNLRSLTLLRLDERFAEDRTHNSLSLYLPQLRALELSDDRCHLEGVLHELPSPTTTLTQLHLPCHELTNSLRDTLLSQAPAIQDATFSRISLTRQNASASRKSSPPQPPRTSRWHKLRVSTYQDLDSLGHLPTTQPGKKITVEVHSPAPDRATALSHGPVLCVAVDKREASATQLLHRLQHDLQITGITSVELSFTRDLQPAEYEAAVQHYTPVLAALWQPTYTLAVVRSTPAILQAVLPVVSQLGITKLCVQGDTEPPAADSNLNLPVTLLHLNDAVLDDSWVRFLLQHAPALQHVLAPEVAVTSNEFATQHCPWTQLSVMQLECSQLLQLPGPATGQPLEVTCKVLVCDLDNRMACKGVKRLQQRVRVTVMDEDTDVVESTAEFNDKSCIKIICPDGTPTEQQPAMLKADLQLAAVTATPIHDHRLVVLEGWTLTPAVMRELKHLPQWPAPPLTARAAETQPAVQPLPDGTVPAMLEFRSIQWSGAGAEYGVLTSLIAPCYTRWLFSTDTAEDSTQVPEAAVQAICAAACLQRSSHYPVRLVVQGERLGWLESVEERIQQWGAEEYVMVECDGEDREEGGGVGTGGNGEDGGRGKEEEEEEEEEETSSDWEAEETDPDDWGSSDDPYGWYGYGVEDWSED